MDLLLNVGLPLSLAFIMFSLGLGLTLGDFARVFQLPRAFVVGAVGQVILLPLIAYTLIQIFGPAPEIALGVMILALCPGGVTSNVLTRIADGSVALSVTLTAVVSLLSVLTVPIFVGWSAEHFMGTAAPVIDVTSLAIAMFLITTVPVAAGVALRHFAPGVTAAAEGWVSRLAMVLFVVIVLAALAANWGLFVQNLASLGPLMVVMNLVLLAIGIGVARITGVHRAMGRAIAIEMGVQNATLGITVAGLIAGTAGISTLAIPSALYGITMYLVTLPVIFWLKRNPILDE